VHRLWIVEWRQVQPGMEREMPEADWEDIAIVGRSSVKEIDDRVEVEWKLNAKPDVEWAEIFQMADLSERKGTLEWVFGGGPDVLLDCVRWFVPANEIDDADTEVRHRLSVANARFRMYRSEQDGRSDE
jgi:hypothetical protein